MLSIELKFMIEALLFCSDKPLSINQLQQQLVMRSSEVNDALDIEDISADSSNPEASITPSESQPAQVPIPLATADEIRQALRALQADYLGRGVQLLEVASGFRFQTSPAVTPWVLQAKSQKTPRYSRALLETLAIIAYKQPITRAEIEDVRGIAVSCHIIKTLQERDWVRVIGHKDVPGKPALLATTRGFLDYFNLRYLQDLPALTDLRQAVTETKEMMV
jgi:segregation and condensation protein B